MNRNSYRIFAALILLVSLPAFIGTGCRSAFRSTTTAAVMPLATTIAASATTAVTAAATTGLPSVVLPRALVELLDVGMAMDPILRTAGYPVRANQAFPTVFRLDDGGRIELSYVDQGTDVFDSHIQSMRIIDTAGTLAIEPRPDAQPIQDFIWIRQQFNLGINESAYPILTLLDQLGTPRSDITESRNSEDFGKHRIRTLTFPGIVLTLYQMQATEHPEEWRVWDTIVTSSGFVTPRGLRVGLETKAVVQLFGTGDFRMFPEYSGQNLTELSISKNDAVNPSDDKEISINFVEGRVSSIRIGFCAP